MCCVLCQFVVCWLLCVVVFCVVFNDDLLLRDVRCLLFLVYCRVSVDGEVCLWLVVAWCLLIIVRCFVVFVVVCCKV